MAPKPWCSAEARTPQHGETAWLWGAGDFQPAGSCSPLTQCQPSSDCKCTRDPKPSKQVLHFLSHRNCEIMKIIAVLSTANDVLVDFFKDNSRLSRKKKKIQICTYCLHGINSPTVANVQLPLWRLSSWEEMQQVRQLHKLAPVYRAAPSAKDRPSAVPNGAPGCVLKLLPQFMWSSPEPCGTRICDAYLC